MTMMMDDPDAPSELVAIFPSLATAEETKKLLKNHELARESTFLLNDPPSKIQHMPVRGKSEPCNPKTCGVCGLGGHQATTHKDVVANVDNATLRLAKFIARNVDQLTPLELAAQLRCILIILTAVVRQLAYAEAMEFDTSHINARLCQVYDYYKLLLKCSSKRPGIMVRPVLAPGDLILQATSRDRNFRQIQQTLNSMLLLTATVPEVPTELLHKEEDTAEMPVAMRLFPMDSSLEIKIGTAVKEGSIRGGCSSMEVLAYELFIEDKDNLLKDNLLEDMMDRLRTGHRVDCSHTGLTDDPKGCTECKCRTTFRSVKREQRRLMCQPMHALVDVDTFARCRTCHLPGHNQRRCFQMTNGERVLLVLTNLVDATKRSRISPKASVVMLMNAYVIICGIMYNIQKTGSYRDAKPYNHLKPKEARIHTCREAHLTEMYARIFNYTAIFLKRDPLVGRHLAILPYRTDVFTPSFKCLYTKQQIAEDVDADERIYNLKSISVAPSTQKIRFTEPVATTKRDLVTDETSASENKRARISVPHTPAAMKITSGQGTATCLMTAGFVYVRDRLMSAVNGDLAKWSSCSFLFDH